MGTPTYTPPAFFTALPAFTLAGLLPPYSGSDPAQPQSLAPYPTSIEVVARTLSHTAKRSEIFRGFLQFRMALQQAGLKDGFQWLNGSFTEMIEVRENRNPNDLDVVTFFRRPPQLRSDPLWAAFVASNPGLFQPLSNKQQYHCDSYFVDLDIDPVMVVAQTRYWYGLFSHRRVTGEWKGMVEVPLAITQADHAAAALLMPGAQP